MGRLLFILLVVAVVAWLIVQLRRPKTALPKGMLEERMVQCAQCGVYLPAKDAAQKHGAHFCERHRPE
jgi:uncharacterized protein